MRFLKLALAALAAILIVLVPVIGLALVVITAISHIVLPLQVTYPIIGATLADMAAILAYAITQSRRRRPSVRLYLRRVQS